MLINDFAVAMNLMAIALLGFFVGALFLSLIWLLFGRFISLYSTGSQKFLIWMWLLGPWILGLTTMLIFSPLFEQTILYAWIERLAHWHHLSVFQLNSWHGVTIIFFIMFSFGLMIIKAAQVYRQGNALYTLKHFSSSQYLCSDSQKVLVIDSDIPTAFTSGFFNPTCYVSKGLVDNLSPVELNIVLEHELAHARNKDPLFIALIACLSAYYPKKLALLLVVKYRLMTEHIADQSTVLKYSAEDVAATIVKVVRLQKYSPVKESSACLSYFGANDITQRIQQLLQPTQKSLSMIIPIIFMLMVLCVTVVAIDATHHLVEYVFTHS